MKLGAQVCAVDEPRNVCHFDLKAFRTVLPLYFEEFVEPRDLCAADLAALTAKCGSYTKVAKLIGTSEAFVRQNAQDKKYSRSRF